MFKLTGKQSLDDCKWMGVEEPQTPEEKEAAQRALMAAMERQARREQMKKVYFNGHLVDPHRKDHPGGYED